MLRPTGCEGRDSSTQSVAAPTRTRHGKGKAIDFTVTQNRV